MSNQSYQWKIEAQDLIKVYKTGDIEVVALRGFSEKIREGEMLAVMGPSGSGKTTFLNMIGGLDRPTSGRVCIDGRDLTRFTDEELALYRRTRVGFVFQVLNLVPGHRLRENIEIPLILAGKSRGERTSRVSELLDLMSIRHRSGHLPSQLSGGEQQKTSIAVALANDPEIVLADEPTADLDSEAVHMVFGLLRSLSRDLHKTIVVATHDVRVRDYSDRVLEMRDGQKIETTEA